MVEIGDEKMSVIKQCDLLCLSHSGFYYKPVIEKERNISIMHSIDRIHTEYPFYGFRRIKIALQEYGFYVGKKLVIRLMKKMGIHTIYPKPKTTVPTSDHVKYPYLLRGINIERSNQVWESDITYIAMEKGYMYLSAIIVVYSRKVLSWQISNTMEAIWCKDILEDAIEKFGSPEIFNSDHGSQYTSKVFIDYLLKNQI
jgi:putative transposase